MPHIIKSKQLLSVNIIPAGVANSTVLAVMPAIDLPMATRAAELMERRSGLPGLQVLVVEDDARQGFIHVVNQVFQQTSSEYFIYCAQDVFAGRNWLAHGVHTMQKQSKGLLAFNDGKWDGLLASFGMVSRAWATSVYPHRLLFNPAYHSHYADTELTLLAMQDGQYCFNPLALLVEVDWGKDSKGTNIGDKQFFAVRKKNFFDGRVLSKELLHLFA